jgi:serine/threonine-protein kinase
MPARLAVLPKPAATMTVATVMAPVTARHAAPKRRRAPMLGLAAGVALALLAGVWVRMQMPAPPGPTASALPTPSVAPSAAASPTAALPADPVPPAGGAEAAATATTGPTARSEEPAPRARPAPRVAATAQGVVALAVAPWGTVLVDGEPRGTTPPLTQLTLPAGRHTIEIRNGDQTPYIAQVDVTPERPAQIRHRFQ